MPYIGEIDACPRCGSDAKQAVEDTRQEGHAVIRRRRRCSVCRAHYTTTEQISERSLRVKKSDGRLEPFDHEGLLRSIRRATIRKYSEDELNELVEAVFTEAFADSTDGVVSSAQVGLIVLNCLKKKDPAAHIRFALVQLGRLDRKDDRRGWIDAEDVRAWLREEYPELDQWTPPGRLVRVVKRDGRREPFDRRKLARSIGRAAKGRDTREKIRELADRISEDVLRDLDVQPVVTSGQIAAEILRTLRGYDQIAYLRYASATKNYPDEKAYEAEAIQVRNYWIHSNRARPVTAAPSSPGSAPRVESAGSERPGARDHRPSTRIDSRSSNP